MLTRETSIIAILPLTLGMLISIRPTQLKTFLVFILPFFLVLCWKYYVVINTNTFDQTEGSGNISFPFMGILPGLIANIDFSSNQKLFQFAFWIAFFSWQIWFVKIVIAGIYKHYPKTPIVPLKSIMLVYVVWLLFALILSPAIYVDDWSFVRVFSLWNFTGILVLVFINKIPGKWFYSYSFAILLLTFIRLIIKQ